MKRTNATLRRMLTLCLGLVFLLVAFTAGISIFAENAGDGANTVETTQAEELDTESTTLANSNTEESSTEATSDTASTTAESKDTTETTSATTEETTVSTTRSQAKVAKAPRAIELKDSGITFDTPTISARIDNTEYTNVTIDPGVIADNLDSVLVNGVAVGDTAKFQRAVLRDANGTESQIAVVVQYNGATYYSRLEDADTAVKLGDGESIILVYSSQLPVNYTFTYDGSTTGSGASVTDNTSTQNGTRYIVAGTNLVGQITAPQDYTVQSVTYNVGSTGGALTVANDGFTLATAGLTDPINITVNLVKTQTYSISKTASSSHGDIASNRLGNLDVLKAAGYYDAIVQYITPDENGRTSQWNIGTGSIFSRASEPYLTLLNYYFNSGNDDENELTYKSFAEAGVDPEPVAAGETAHFIISSESNTGGNKWALTNLNINGNDITIPAFTEGTSVSTTITNKDGSQSVVTVTFADGDGGYIFLDEDATLYRRYMSWDKERTWYEVNITNVHEDIEVEYNFIETGTRQYIIKDRTGIDRVTMSAENGRGVDYHYYYTLQAESSEYVYAGYYQEHGDNPSNNLLVYTVKPGYNPYTVYIGLSYDYGAITTDGVRLATANGTVEEVILNAGSRYHTGHRHWGQHDNESECEEDRYGALLLDALEQDSTYNQDTWYGVALEENEADVQQLYLRASPYQYHAEYDLEGGEFIDELASNYTQTTGTDGDNWVIDTTTYTLENGETFTNMPAQTPTKTGYTFAGWQFVETKEVTLGGTYDATKQSANCPEGYTATGYVQHELTTTYYYERVTDATYGENEQFLINENSIESAGGDETLDEGRTFTFRAKWNAVSGEAESTQVEFATYKEVIAGTAGTTENPVVTVGGKTYQRYYYNEDVQLVGETVILSSHEPENVNAYTYNSSISRVTTTTTTMNADGSYPDENKLYTYFDYKYQTLTVTKDIEGLFANMLGEFDITVTLVPTTDSVYPLPANGTTVTYGDCTFTSTGSALVGTVTLGDNDTATISGIPYGYQYTVEEKELPTGYNVTYNGNTTPATGTLTEDANVAIVNEDITKATDTGLFTGTGASATLLGVLGLTGATWTVSKAIRRKQQGRAE